jgi:hypothetical protein
MKYELHFQAKQSRFFYPLPPVNLKYLFHLVKRSGNIHLFLLKFLQFFFDLIFLLVLLSLVLLRKDRN